eukprot:TRINITY_DN5059_c0_g1_i19.p1 TRINITY_DN5059_c0_g1~~TRINITY_DN5059_c0_g1_i19.p1  ORF type:complete len:427 (-),score=64.44 TRINITY_DN5059_c0_g1_i19:294-1574(-)
MGSSCGTNKNSGNAIRLPRRADALRCSDESAKTFSHSALAKNSPPVLNRKHVKTKKKMHCRSNMNKRKCNLTYKVANNSSGLCSMQIFSNCRWVAWKTALGVHHRFIPGKYSLLKLAKYDCNCLKIIANDVSRTFTSLSYNRKSLENILATYAVCNRDVGYCQGMNYLAGILLLASNSNEEEAFWAFTSLMEQKISSDKVNLGGLEQLYKRDFPLVNLMLRLFERILKEGNGELARHLSGVGLPTELWLQKWISSLFLYSFPVEYCVKFWDTMMSNGVSFFLPISIVIVRKLAGRLMEVRTMEKCNEILKIPEHIRKDCIPDPDLITQEASHLRIDWKELELSVDCESSVEIPTDDCCPLTGFKDYCIICQPNEKQMLFPDLCFFTNSQLNLSVHREQEAFLRQKAKGSEGGIYFRKENAKAEFKP